MHSHKNSDKTSHSYNSNNSGNTQHPATTGTTVPSSCIPERTVSRTDAALAHRKHQRQQQQQLQQKQRPTASYSVENTSQRQVTQGPESPSSGPEQQNARASFPTCGGPSMTEGTSDGAAVHVSVCGVRQWLGDGDSWADRAGRGRSGMAERVPVTEVCRFLEMWNIRETHSKGGSVRTLVRYRMRTPDPALPEDAQSINKLAHVLRKVLLHRKGLEQEGPAPPTNNEWKQESRGQVHLEEEDWIDIYETDLAESMAISGFATRMKTSDLRDSFFFAARHPASNDMCPAAGAQALATVLMMSW